MTEPNERDFSHNETYDERDKVKRAWDEARIAVAGREMASLQVGVSHVLDALPDQSKRAMQSEALLGEVVRALAAVTVDGRIDEEKMKVEAAKLPPVMQELMLRGGDVVIRIQRGTDIPAPFNGTMQLVRIFENAIDNKSEEQED